MIDILTQQLAEEMGYLANDQLVQSLQQRLSEQLGQPVRLHLRRVQETVASPAIASERAQQRELSDAERAINEDETVRSLKDSFGARILKDSVQPLQ